MSHQLIAGAGGVGVGAGGAGVGAGAGAGGAGAGAGLGAGAGAGLGAGAGAGLPTLKLPRRRLTRTLYLPSAERVTVKDTVCDLPASKDMS